MRRNLALVVLPVTWVACFSNSSGGPSGTPNFDGSPGTEFDSSTPDVTQEAEVEASAEASLDASVDATADARNEAEAGPSPAVVTIGGALGVEPGVTVVWGDATGAVVATGVTDATGTATHAITGTTVTMVTALMGTPIYPALYTITGIEPGDDLVILDWGSLQNLPVAGDGFESNVASLPSPQPTNTVSFTAYAGQCNTNFTTVPESLSLTQWPGCIGVGPLGSSYAAAYPAVVDANDANFDLLGFVFAKNNPLTMPDDAGLLDVPLASGAWSTATTFQSVTETNKPTTGIYDAYANYSEVADGVLMPLPQRTAPADAGLPAANDLFATHVGYADFVQTELFYNPDHDGFVQEGYALATRGPAPTANGAPVLDWSPLASLPSLTGLTIDSSTPAQPSMTWTTVTGTLAASTGIIIYTTWNATSADGGYQSGTWTLVSAGTAQSSLQAPMLPTSSAWAPVGGAEFSLSAIYAVQGGTALSTYPQIRAASSAFRMQTSCLGSPMLPPLPSAGTAMVVGYTTGGCG
jgi:hypothetical protein